VYKWILLGHAIGGGTLFGAHVYLEGLTAQANRSADTSTYMTVMLRATNAADRLLGIASIVTVVFGVWLVVDTAYDWGDLFVTIGMSAWLLAFAVTLFLLNPRTREIKAAVAEGGIADEVAVTGMKSLVNVIHLQSLLVAIAFIVMVIKPGIL
jgi:F0F1-type ATP synthase assembly protein I